jgi:hypothetical protein
MGAGEIEGFPVFRESPFWTLNDANQFAGTSSRDACFGPDKQKSAQMRIH